MKIFGVVLLSIFLVSCAAIQGLRKTESTSAGRGVWHRVKEGQTLWRIAKTYRVTLDEVKEANDLTDTVNVSEGTWLFIPKAERVLYVQGNSASLPPESKKLDFAWPLKGEVVRSFGKFKDDFNYGIDLKTAGTQNVVASERGTIILSGTIRGYGNTIIIEHESDFCSLYSRNIESLVKEGQQVEKNTVIARVSTGRLGASRDDLSRSGPGKGPEGDVIHYELFYKGKPVNPLYYLP